jgi:hypothetical protein
MNILQANASLPELLLRMQRTLHLNQRELGELIGVSSRTMIRYYQRGGTILPHTYEKLAIACHAGDRALAAELARRAGKTLVEMGLEKPPAPPPPPSPPPAPATPPAPPRPQPTARHLADSIVCVAAEAMGATPQAARPAVIAAFERAVALGMTAQDALDAMAPTPLPPAAPPAPPAPSTPPPKPPATTPRPARARG